MRKSGRTEKFIRACYFVVGRVERFRFLNQLFIKKSVRLVSISERIKSQKWGFVSNGGI
jgi:hypothetical protein